MIRFSEWLASNKKYREHDAFVICGPRGSGKTTHMNAIAYELAFNYRIKYCFDFDDLPEDLHNYDCIFLDDFATKFYKRDSSTKKNKEFAKLIQEIREVLPMIITTAPDISLFDKDIRAMFKPLYIVSSGILVMEGGFSFGVDLFIEGFSKYLLELKEQEIKLKRERAKRFIENVKNSSR
jgi:AAA+ ATPase superfamily predicted ATPase